MWRGDWVELPSQLLENWAWEEEPLGLLSAHWETGESLPAGTLDRLLRSRRFMGGWRQMRQLSFGTLDLALHTEYEAERDGDAVGWATAVMEPFTPGPNHAEAHPLPSFLHIFSGGYAASYYSYLWSEVLEADVFTRFAEEGLFDRPTGRRYLDTILATGDSEDPETLFRTFMGRDPDPEALIREKPRMTQGRGRRAGRPRPPTDTAPPRGNRMHAHPTPPARRTLTLALALLAAGPPAAAQETPRTGPEISGYTEYTSYGEMMDYLAAVQASGTEMRLGIYGETRLRRELPYAVFARPSVTRPWEAWALGKPILVLAANVHGNEPTFRESVLLLLRDLATPGTEMNRALDELTILVVPQLNPDGFSTPDPQRGQHLGARSQPRLHEARAAGDPELRPGTSSSPGRRTSSSTATTGAPTPTT